MGLLAERFGLFAGLPKTENPTLVAFVTIFSLVLLALVSSTIKQYYRLSHIKGPPGSGFSIFWLLTTVAGPKMYLDFWEVNKRYGPIARVGPNDLVTSDTELWKHMCATRSAYSRSQWYEAMKFNPTKNNCLSWRDEAEHQRLRSKMAAGYSGRAVEGLEQKIDQNVIAFAKLIDDYASQNKPLDFGFKAQYFTLDVLSDVAFGKPFGFLSTDSDVYDYISTTEHTVRMTLVTSVVPWLIKVLTSPTFKRFLPSDQDQLGFGKVMGVAKKVAAERFGPDRKVRRDMVGSFVAQGLTESEVESEILLQIIAGSDTTATAIRCIILHVITNPRVLSKLRAEISSVRYDTAVIPDALARKMPYLQAVIKEGLRIWPPISSLQSKEVPPEGDTWKGTYLPGSTRIGYGAWGMFRDPEKFGEDANEFRPERWLDEPSDRIREMESAFELVFSYGRYQCLGKPVALIELNKVFVLLLTRFDLTICNPQRPWEVKNPGIFNMYNFWIRAYRRDSFQHLSG